MKRPTNRAEFFRYLEQNKYLVYRCPGLVRNTSAPDVIEGRVYVGRSRNKVSLHKVGCSEAGATTFMEFVASEMEFFEDRVEVKFPESWSDLADERMVYFYASEPFHPSQRERYEKVAA
jgi:hypothetical protein